MAAARRLRRLTSQLRPSSGPTAAQQEDDEEPPGIPASKLEEYLFDLNGCEPPPRPPCSRCALAAHLTRRASMERREAKAWPNFKLLTMMSLEGSSWTPTAVRSRVPLGAACES